MSTRLFRTRTAWRTLVYTRRGRYKGALQGGATRGRYKEAVEALSKVQDLPKSYNDVGYVAMVGGKLEDAQGLFAEAKRLSPDFYTLADTNQRRVEIMQGHAAAP